MSGNSSNSGNSGVSGVFGAPAAPPPPEILQWFNPDLDPANRALIQDRIDAGGFWAWRAQNTPGTPWLNGPANYAETLISDEGNAVALVEGNGAVPWAAATGWGFVAAFAQWLDTNIVPPNNQTYVVFIQYANALNVANQIPIGAWNTGAQGLYLWHRSTIATVRYFSAGFVEVAPIQLNGNLCVAGAQGYRNGVIDGAPIGAPAGVNNRDLYVGALNNVGAAGFFCTVEIHAILICDDATAVLPSIAALAALPNGSMHNL